ncbi:MAG: HigA family addiction module antitoxin [Albidovulum sp.]|nr:HigA family addiction module antitoxin [Albidovulum sp.]
MSENASDRVGPMQNPPHLGELIRESMDDVGWNVTETAARLGCERGTLSRLLNGKAGVSANMALALEDIGWGTAEHWMRMKASYELAQARRERVATERRSSAWQGFDPSHRSRGVLRGYTDRPRAFIVVVI